jgi:hypothetical protein
VEACIDRHPLYSTVLKRIVYMVYIATRPFATLFASRSIFHSSFPQSVPQSLDRFISLNFLSQRHPNQTTVPQPRPQIASPFTPSQSSMIQTHLPSTEPEPTPRPKPPPFSSSKSSPAHKFHTRFAAYQPTPAFSAVRQPG